MTQESVPKLHESESGQMVLEKSVMSILMYTYHKQYEIMHKTQWKGYNDQL